MLNAILDPSTIGAAVILCLARRVNAATGNVVAPLAFNQVSESIGVSAQQMFLGAKGRVYVLDKTENNPVNITNELGTHPAWAVEYDTDDNTYRTMDVWTNTFCAGGGVLGNGSWVVFGGNQPITVGGAASNDKAGAYDDTDGGTAIRMIDPCEDQSCEWMQGASTYANSDDTGGYLRMLSRRWYPTVEVLEDGTMIVIGGDQWGGYVNGLNQDNPTYEFFPRNGTGETYYLPFLHDTLPTNLFPLTWLMPSGKLFMQASRSSMLYDWRTNTTEWLPNMPYATRVYPASAATAMLPLTPDTDYTPTILFCGGSNPPTFGTSDGPGFNITALPADNSCVRISPDSPGANYTDDDFLPEGRSMGEFVHLPDGTMWMGNGVGMGTAGYGPPFYSIGEGFGQNPTYTPAIYNPNAPSGSKWNRTGLVASSNERMYHSTAILLPDSSVLIAGSNPNADFNNDQWRSRTDAERWYPWYYNEERPELPPDAPSTLSYGGDYWNITLNTTDESVVSTAMVSVLRGGFHTHCMGFGMRYLQLNSTYTIDETQSISTLHVSQMPGYPGPTLYQPGPALMFLVVGGVASEGQFIMVGSGQLGEQPTADNADLPVSQTLAVQPKDNTTSEPAETSNNTKTKSKSGAGSVRVDHAVLAVTIVLTGFCLLI